MPNFPHLPDQKLFDPQYRSELLGKVEALLLVLERTHEKVLGGMHAPGSDHNRLAKICHNLEHTLEVCRRAKKLLSHTWNEDVEPGEQMELRYALADLRAQLGMAPHRTMNYREYIEIQHMQEFRRFQTLGPIQRQELLDADLDTLCARLARTKVS
ncbi:MAG: hypothetical protein DWQ01_07375 [Planctomycetota bacterium]|nr:MAG: hypothetical protein DWQ01_07375 [Planctomycetota bacterium]